MNRPGVVAAAALAIAAVASPTTSVAAPGAQPGDWPDPPAVTAEAYVLADLDTGQVLAARNPDEVRPVASTVKILTALTALAHAGLDDVVTVGSEIRGIAGASVGLRRGDRVTVGELLEALVARSGNDAAHALAVHVAGSVPAFVDLMAEQADGLGLGSLQLATPHGLDDRNRLSARDLMVIAMHAMADERFREIAGRPTVTLSRAGTVMSRNELLASPPGATGIKTGYTTAAGFSVVASSRRGGIELVAVVLGADGHDARFTDARRLLEHGHDRFVSHLLRLRHRLARPGPDAWLTLPRRRILAPPEPDARPVPPVPVEIPEQGPDVPVLWGEHRLTTVRSSLGPDTSPPGHGGVGAALAARAYAAMRVAHAADLWSAVPGAGAPLR